MTIRYSELMTLTTDTGDLENPEYRVMSENVKGAVVKRAEWAQRRFDKGIYVPPTNHSSWMRGYTQGIEGYRRQNRPLIGYRFIGIPTDGFWSRDIETGGLLGNKALIKALNNLKNQNVNLAQAFAERQRTADMVGRSAIEIARDIRNFRKWLGDPNKWDRLKREFCDVQRRRGLRDGIGDRWLELQYGWKPLLSDIYGGMVHLYENDKGTYNRYRVTVKANANQRTSEIGLRTTSVPGQRGATYSRSVAQSVNVRLDYHLENPFLASGNALGLTNPASLVWELVPYSFVVDWFVPIGAYLSSMDASVGYRFIGGFSTHHQTGSAVITDQGYDCVSSNPAYPNAASFLSSSGSAYAKYVSREIYTSNPVPRFPGIKNPISLSHMANGLALLSQALFGR